MNRSDIDWPFIRRHTLTPSITAIVSVVLLLGGVWVDDEQRKLYSRFSNNQDAVHQDYDALVYRRRLVDQYHRRYKQFHDLGFVGRESRLDWIEALRRTSEELILPRVSYAIEPQLQVVAPVESVLNGAGIQIHLSRLELEMGLLHEIDLLRVLDQLQRNAPGLIKVDRCELNWQADRTNGLTADSNILANCAIQIFSVITSDITTAPVPL